MWGDSFLQRLRFMPLYLAMVIADRLPRGRARSLPGAHRPGLSVVIPERDAPLMLEQALESVSSAAGLCGEPLQVIVVANGASAERYRELAGRYPEVEWSHHAEPLGFSAAVAAGLERARHDWTFLMNNDMVLEHEALAHLARHRERDVFAVSCQIEQRSGDGRREETGFTDWHRDGRDVRLFHADHGESDAVREHLCASGGASLFRTQVLRRYVRDTRCFDPFYWEDVDWSVRAWRDGMRVLFCPQARARHRHRATVARFYDAAAIDRVIARNALAFEARHALTEARADAILTRMCELPYESQRNLAHPRHALGVLRLRRGARAAPLPTPPIRPISRGVAGIEIPPRSYCYRLGLDPTRSRPRLLVVTPFCVYPPRHGSARRLAEMLRMLKRDHDVILVGDEAARYDTRSYPGFDGLAAVHLVQRPDTPRTQGETSLEGRMRSHSHRGLHAALEEALKRYEPDIVQVEHVELAPLIVRRTSAQKWVLTLHDACEASDFHHEALARRFSEDILPAYDAVVVCSSEDAALVQHSRTVCVPNGARVPGAYRPSSSAQLLFMGPFRYERNVEGIRSFLRHAFPAIRSAVPDARLVVLGGDEAAGIVNGEDVFHQPGVELLAHREDVPRLLAESALTINPLNGIRGSAVKLVESLMAGRICVSTEEGARGFRDSDFPALVSVDAVAGMVEPIVALLRNERERHRIEAPRAEQLAPFAWEECAARQRALYQELLGSA